MFGTGLFENVHLYGFQQVTSQSGRPGLEFLGLRNTVLSVAEINRGLQLQGGHLFCFRGTLVKPPKVTWNLKIIDIDFPFDYPRSSGVSMSNVASVPSVWWL